MATEAPAAPRLTLAEIRAARALLGDRILTTPVLPLLGPAVEAAFAPGTRAFLKLELFQHTGSFKARGALVNALALTEDERARGICAISAGNHAIAAAFAARAVGTSAKVVMKEGASPFRVAECRRYGGEVVFEADFHAGFAGWRNPRTGRPHADPSVRGPRTARAPAPLGLEFIEQAPGPRGRDRADRRGRPRGRPRDGDPPGEARLPVFGVEPFGADTMYRSFAAGSPRASRRSTPSPTAWARPMPCRFPMRCAAPPR